MFRTLAALLLVSTSTLAAASVCDVRMTGHKGQVDLSYNPKRFSQLRPHPLISNIFQQVTDSTYLAQTLAGNAAIYDYKQQTVVREFPMRTAGRETNVAFSQDATVGLTADYDTIRIYDLNTGTLRKEIPYAVRRPKPGPDTRWGWNTVMITKDNQRAFLNGYNGEFVVVDLVAGTVKWEAPAGFPSFFGAQFIESPDGRYVLANVIESDRILYDRTTDSGSIVPKSNDRNYYTYGSVFSLDSKSIISRSLYRKLVRYDIASQTYSGTNATVDAGELYLDTSTDGQTLVVGHYLDPVGPLNQTPFALVDLTNLQEIPTQFPQRDYKKYIGFGVDHTQNAVTAINDLNFWIFNLANQEVTEYILPAQFRYGTRGDISRDGLSVFAVTGGGQTPYQVFEAFTPN